MRVLQQDLVFAFRQLRKTPGFTITVLLTLALGIPFDCPVQAAENGHCVDLTRFYVVKRHLFAMPTCGKVVNLRLSAPYGVRRAASGL
jgi:hypothetical protein